jgi:hypothetical protein
MIPLCDLAYSYLSSRSTIPVEEPMQFSIERRNDDRIRNICVVPTSVLASPAISRRIMPTSGTNFVYPVRAQYHITPDGKETRQRVRAVYHRARQDALEGQRNGEKLSITGVSLGCVIATRLAHEFESERLTLVVPGDRLGECAVGSRLTGKIVAQAPCEEEYVESLREFDPIEYVDRLQAREIDTYIRGMDLLIPGSRGRILCKELKRKNPRAEIKEWWFADHFIAILLASSAIHKRNSKK